MIPWRGLLSIICVLCCAVACAGQDATHGTDAVDDPDAGSGAARSSGGAYAGGSQGSGASPNTGGRNDTGGESPGGTGGAGSDGSGGSSSGDGGHAGSGGEGGTGGSDICGPCPAAACGKPVHLNVTVAADALPANLADLTITGDVDVPCYVTNGCSAVCESVPYQLDNGHYSLTLTATGFEPQLFEFDLANPTDCGCCGCCPGSVWDTVTLVPAASGPSPEPCCANLDSDELNCGSCGTACDAGQLCSSGTCASPQ
jgi:hypothetical protein